MNTQIVITNTAKSDFRDVDPYLADLSKDKRLAIRFVKELRKKRKSWSSFRSAVRFPEIGY